MAQHRQPIDHPNEQDELALQRARPGLERAAHDVLERHPLPLVELSRFRNDRDADGATPAGWTPARRQTYHAG
jgi:hypothetical protein